MELCAFRLRFAYSERFDMVSILPERSGASGEKNRRREECPVKTAVTVKPPQLQPTGGLLKTVSVAEAGGNPPQSG